MSDSAQARRKHRRMSNEAAWGKLMRKKPRSIREALPEIIARSLVEEEAAYTPDPDDPTIPQPGIHPRQPFRRIRLTPQQERGLSPVGTAFREYQECQLRRHIKGTPTIPASEFESAIAESISSDPEDIMIMWQKLANPIEFLHIGAIRPLAHPDSDMGVLERFLLANRTVSPGQITKLLRRPEHAWLETLRNLQRKISKQTPATDHRIAWTIHNTLIVANLQSWEETDSSQVVRYIIRPPRDVRSRFVRRVIQPPPYGG